MRFTYWLVETGVQVGYWVDRHGRGIKPGMMIPPTDNWPTDELWQFAEKVFEEVRKRMNPTAPSRLGAVFLCPSVNACSTYSSGKVVYECRILSGKTFLTDGAYWTEAFIPISRAVQLYKQPIQEAMQKYKEDMEAWAEQYWKGAAPVPEFPEIIVNGQVQVIGIAGRRRDKPAMPIKKISPETSQAISSTS